MIFPVQFKVKTSLDERYLACDFVKYISDRLKIITGMCQLLSQYDRYLERGLERMVTTVSAEVAKLETRLATFPMQYFPFPGDICATCRRKPVLSPIPVTSHPWNGSITPELMTFVSQRTKWGLLRFMGRWYRGLEGGKNGIDWRRQTFVSRET